MSISEPESASGMLPELRGRMTAVTLEIARLLVERNEIGLAIGDVKADAGATQIRDLEREEAVLSTVVDATAGEMPEEAVRYVFQALMDVSSEEQARRTGLPLGVPTRQTQSTFGPPVRPDDVTVIRRHGW